MHILISAYTQRTNLVSVLIDTMYRSDTAGGWRPCCFLVALDSLLHAFRAIVSLREPSPYTCNNRTSSFLVIEHSNSISSSLACKHCRTWFAASEGHGESYTFKTHTWRSVAADAEDFCNDARIFIYNQVFSTRDSVYTMVREPV